MVGNRLPANDYQLIDRLLFDIYKEKYNAQNLFDELFSFCNSNLGYIKFYPYDE